MIRALLLILAICLPGVIWARAVDVTSGEHAGFTRLVLDFGAPVAWQFGRTDDGYEFRTTGDAVDYDLKGVFNLIGKSRLAAIAAVPQSSLLNIGFACACHAIPFEFRPGIIVIDLRDGPPPKGSSFEEALAPADPMPADPMPADPAPPQTADLPGYDWTEAILNPVKPQGAGLAPKPSSDPALQPLRDQLLRQLSRGAAEGVVTLELPKKAAPSDPKPGIDAARVALGEMPGVQIEASAKEADSLGEVGAVCATAEDLNIDTWGSDTPIAGQFSSAFTGLLGEFDRADPQAVAKGVRFLLYIGFGLEARQMIATLAPDAPDASMLSSLGAVVDGNSDPQGFFAGQASCDTPAALFALLAIDRVTAGEKVNEKAVILAFSNLPAHLRRLLGPDLVQKFLDHQDAASAESIRNAILRAGGETSAQVAVAEAKIEMSQGDPQAAQQHLEAAVPDSGVARPEALIELVNALVAQGLPIDPKIPQDLAALQSEIHGTKQAAELDHALTLARASSGDFAAAFDQMDPAQDDKIWDILARLGTDSDVLAWAVQGQVPADLGLDTAGILAGRLQGLGLPDAALAWVLAYPELDAATRARVHLDRRDGRAALKAAGQVAGEDGARLQAAALELLGDHGAAAAAFSTLNDATAQQFAYAKAGQWQDLRAMAPNSWTAVLAAMDPPAPPVGPLAAGQDLVASSAKTRAALTDLLASIPKTP